MGKMDDLDFKIATVNRPTDCGTCGKLLVGLVRQGVSCRSCGTVLHRTCRNYHACASEPVVAAPEKSECDKLISVMLEAGADESERSTSLLGSEHAFSAKTFARPTRCCVCDKLLLGVVHQGLGCAECGSAVHRGCVSRAHTTVPCVAADRQDRKPLLEAQLAESVETASPAAHWHLEEKEKEKEKEKEPVEQMLATFSRGVSARLDSLDATMEQHFAAYNGQAQDALESALASAEQRTSEQLAKVERDGLGTTVSQSLKRGTQSVVGALEGLAKSAQTSLAKQDRVEVDPDVLEALDSVSAGAQVVGNAGFAVLASVRDATAAVIEKAASSDVGKELSEGADPEVTHAIASGLKGAGEVLNQCYSSIQAIGSAAGDVTVNVATHVYGDDVGRAARSGTDIVGAGYKTYATGASLLSGSALFQAPIRTAPRYTLRERAVFNECMYACVHDMLAFKDVTLLSHVLKVKDELAEAVVVAAEEAMAADQAMMAEQAVPVALPPSRERITAESTSRLSSSEEYQFEYEIEL